MKKSLIITSVVVSILFACTAKKATTGMETPKAEATLSSKLSAVQTKYPDATLAELEKGKSVSKTACVSCHKEKDYTLKTDEKMFKEIDVMSKKAKISDSDKQALIRYVTALRAPAN